MAPRAQYNALNRLLTVLERSLPNYLSYASPWISKGDDRAVETLRRIVDDQQQLAARVSELVLEYGPMTLGEYPVEFYDMHDLSFNFLLGKLIEYQKRDIATLEGCVEQLQNDRVAAAVAEETLGSARAHLEILEELAEEAGRASSSWSVT